MMLLTVEVRWFLPGAIPEELCQWFEQDNQSMIKQEDREDWYLHLPKQPKLGIKLRAGNLEIKNQLDEHKVQKLTKGTKGRVEKWLKWSFALSSQDKEQSNLSASENWIKVQKTRRSKTYRVTSNGEIELIRTNEAIDQGCHIEIAELSVLNQEWHSIGAEAFGQEDTLELTLKQVLKTVLLTPNIPSLKAKDSYSYPKWLTKLKDN